MSKPIKAFIIPQEAWYSNLASENPSICIGMYYEDGSTVGEFEIEWNNIGLQLHSYNDSWIVLRQMDELMNLLADIDEQKLNINISEFAEMLRSMGYKDITQREKRI